MRTTITLDPDVAQMLKEEAHRQRKTFKDAVNDALRRGLAPGGPRRPEKPFRVRVHRAKLRAGHDRAGFNRLADELEDAATLAKVARKKR